MFIRYKFEKGEPISIRGRGFKNGIGDRFKNGIVQTRSFRFFNPTDKVYFPGKFYEVMLESSSNNAYSDVEQDPTIDRLYSGSWNRYIVPERKLKRLEGKLRSIGTTFHNKSLDSNS